MSEPPRGSGEGWRAAGWPEGAEQSRSDKPAEKEETIKIGSRSYGSGPQPNIDMAEKKGFKKLPAHSGPSQEAEPAETQQH